MPKISRQPGTSALRDLRRRIVLNEIQPGAVLTELGLAETLGCSQAAVREALLRLEGEGLVARAGRQGTTVTALDRDAAEEILALRRRIETGAVRRIVPRTGSGDVAALEAELAAMRTAARDGDLWAMVEADIAFHLALFRIAALPAMEPILARCILHTHRFRLWAPWHRRRLTATAARHAPILAALAARDATALAEALGHHLDTIVEKPTVKTKKQQGIPG